MMETISKMLNFQGLHFGICGDKLSLSVSFLQGYANIICLINGLNVSVEGKM